MSSLAARYCEANAISSAAFAAVIWACSRRGPAGVAVDLSKAFSHCTVVSEAFNVRTLSRILGEPPSIIETMSHHPFLLGSWDLTQRIAGSKEEAFAELWGCPECLRLGYHSVLHQVAWIKRC